MALLIGLLKVIGGIALLTGILTRIASILLIGNMIGAIMLVKIEKGYVGGAELDMFLLSICATLLIMGPGRASIETYNKERCVLEGKTRKLNNLKFYHNN